MTGEDRWREVDSYYANMLFQADADMKKVLQNCVAAGLPPISVSEAQGKFLHLLIQIQKAERILEIGTLGAYSTIWMARALPPSGRIISLEVDRKHADVAEDNIKMAGMEVKVDVRVGQALDLLSDMEKKGEKPFDLVFIDADKPNNPSYLKCALKLTKAGSLIVADNMVRGGRVVEFENRDPALMGIRRYNDLVAREPRLSSTVIQTVGDKGYDGFMLTRVMS